MSIYLASVQRLLAMRGDTTLYLVVTSSSTPSTNPDDIVISKTQDQMTSYQGKYKAREIDGTLIKATDIKLYVDPSTISTVPTTSFQVTDGSTTYSIKNVDTFKDGTTIALYILQLRK